MTGKPFLIIVVSGAGPAPRVTVLIEEAQRRGWDVGVATTPMGRSFIDTDKVQDLTGRPVRCDWRSSPTDPPESFPPAAGLIVAPATFNTVCKLAAGFADNLALSIVCEAVGAGVPTAVLPYVNTSLAAHIAYPRALADLRTMGVKIGSHQPHQPKQGGAEDRYCWNEGLELITNPVR
ncbi:flavoprotein (plasmid) [Streptomyces sp. BI20]|uniref:flavoprotein n=1 Tax=Streptomyces sp. BI20 TaxID=3403460 RepID=UPI003C736BB2